MKTQIVKISKGNTKLGSIPNISIVPVADCRNCTECRDDCYALQSYKQYPNVRTAWKGNSQLFRKNMKEAFKQVNDYLTKNIAITYFRIHVAGDFINQKHLNGWCEVARNNPNKRFLAYTKTWKGNAKYRALSFHDIPANLKIVFSMWPTEKKLPPRGFSIAWVQDGTENRIGLNAFICPDKCDTCGKCWEMNYKTDVIFYNH